MKIVDMSHVMNVHTPGWVGYAGNKMYYAQNLQTQMIVAQRIDTALHVGTHFDGEVIVTPMRTWRLSRCGSFAWPKLACDPTDWYSISRP